MNTACTRRRFAKRLAAGLGFALPAIFLTQSVVAVEAGARVAQESRSAATGTFTLPALEPASETPAPPESALLRHVVFRGNTVFTDAELEALLAAYLDREVNEADLETIRLVVTRHYVDHGYVNSGARLGELHDGRLRIDIVEGRLQAIRLRGMDGLADRYLVDRLARDRDAVLQLDELRERFQLLLDDPLFKRMNARLLPGSAPGQALLDVEVERARPWQFSLFANNYRSPSIGANALGLNSGARNLTGIGDQLDLTLQSAIDDWQGKRATLAWRIPINSLGTQLSLQLDHGRSAVLEEPMRALDIRSVLDSREVGVAQTVVETLDHRFSVGASQVERTNRTTLAGEPFSFVAGASDGVTKVSASRWWQEYNVRSERWGFSFRSTFSFARDNLQPTSGLPATAIAPADRSYSFWLGQANYATKIAANGAQFIVRATTQQTAHRLLSLDRISIGGINSVRGYRENQLLRDHGDVLNVEVDLPLLRRNEIDLTCSFVPFFDIGRGRNQGEAAETISSLGVATRLRWQGVRLDLAVARRLHYPASVRRDGNTLQDKAIHLQLAYDFR